MEKINRFNIVRIHLAGAPIDGLEGTVLDEEPRADGLHYFVDVKGEDCTWILPENALEPIGQVENRHRGWDGAKLVPWDVIEVAHPGGGKERFQHRRGVVQGKTRQMDDWWYTVELDSGETVILQESELVLVEESQK